MTIDAVIASWRQLIVIQAGDEGGGLAMAAGHAVDQAIAATLHDFRP